MRSCVGCPTRWPPCWLRGLRADKGAGRAEVKQHQVEAMEAVRHAASAKAVEAAQVGWILKPSWSARR